MTTFSQEKPKGFRILAIQEECGEQCFQIFNDVFDSKEGALAHIDDLYSWASVFAGFCQQAGMEADAEDHVCAQYFIVPVNDRPSEQWDAAKWNEELFKSPIDICQVLH